MRDAIHTLTDVDFAGLGDAASDLVDYLTGAYEWPTGHERAALDPSGNLTETDVLDLIDDALVAADYLYRIAEYVENLSTLI